jgi:outer membrane receptor protein involved in Fe transport
LGNYGWGSVSNVADWTTKSFDINGQLLAQNPELVQITGGNKNQQATFQIDFVNPLNDSTKLEMGTRNFFSGRDQNYLFNEYSYDKKAYVQDNYLSQDFDITENINAAYVTYSSRWKHQISYQIGVRFEQSSLSGISNLAAVKGFGYNYPKGTGTDLARSFFPAVYLSKKIDEKTELGLNFSRKIQRPGFRQLMPGVQGSDKQNITIGNPNLQPEFINLAELSYNKIFGSNNWLATIYIADETNTLKPLTYRSPTDPSVKITTFVNGTNEVMYGVDNTLKLTFGKNLELMLNANVYNFTVNVDTFHNSGWTWNSKANMTYKFPADISMQINGGYEADRPAAQGTRKGVSYMDFALKKSFFHNAANITFSISDAFNTRREISILDQPSYYQESMRRRDTRFYKLSVQIPFGKADASMFKKMKEGRKQGGQEQPDFGG